MKSLFITGTDTDVGKTYITAGLAIMLRKMGVDVGVERIVEIEFTSDEKIMFDHSVSAVKQLNELASKFEK